MTAAQGDPETNDSRCSIKSSMPLASEAGWRGKKYKIAQEERQAWCATATSIDNHAVGTHTDPRLVLGERFLAW
jgi:hypothetical protein